MCFKTFNNTYRKKEISTQVHSGCDLQGALTFCVTHRLFAPRAADGNNLFAVK